MRILDVSPRVTLPLSSGSRIRMYNLLSRLSERHEVRQFSQARILDLRRRGFETEKQITPSYREYRYGSLVGSPLCEIMERSGFGVPLLCGYTLTAAKPRRLREWADWADVVVVEFPWQYGYCRSVTKGKPLVLATHNVEAAKIRSAGDRGGLGRLWSAWTEALERRAVLDADLVLAVSPEDREEFARFYGADAEKIAVIPNGADVDLYYPADEATRSALRSRLKLPAGPIVIFPAYHPVSTEPGGAEMGKACGGAAPGGDVSDHGRRGKTSQGRRKSAFHRICKRLRVPSSIRGLHAVSDRPWRRYKDQADRVRCRRSSHRGVPESVRGTTFRPGEHLLVADKSAEALAAAVRLLLDDPDTAKRMGASARAHAVQHHDWGRIARTMESYLLGLIESPRRRQVELLA